MEKTIKDALRECNKISSTIMTTIEEKLNTEGIEFSCLSQSEIIVNNNTKKKISEIIADIEDITKDKLKLLITITESDNNVFIRQNFN